MGNKMRFGNLEIPEKGKYDVIALGALVIRLDPGNIPFREARHFDVHVSGAEYNFAANLARYGLKTAVVTGMGDYCVGELIREHVRAVNVDILGKTFPHTPWTGHHATVYSATPRGCATNRIDYNRSNEAALMLQPGMLDYTQIFNGGVKWVHSGGLFAALGEHTSSLIVEFFKEAKKQGAIVSFDLNYRGKLWESHGGQTKAIEAMTEIVKYADVLFGNESDMKNALGLSSSIIADSSVDPKPFVEVQKLAMEKFPNLKIIVTSLRDEINNDRHMWGAVASVGGEIFYVPAKEISVLCRIGGGDGLASGFAKAVFEGLPADECLKAGWASGALVASVHGDITGSTWQDVLDVSKGSGKKVER